MRTRREFIGTCLAAAAALAAGTAIAQEGKIVIVSWGGDYQDALRDAYWTPFAKATGLTVVEDTRPLPPRIKAMVDTGKVDWDIVDLTDAQYMEVHKLGGFEPIDYAKLDAESLKLIDKKGQKADAVMHQMASVGLAYRTDVFKTDKPKSWADFWDVKKFPGPRALGAPIGAGAYGTLEAALLADGVALDKLYPLDVDRAFRKLDQIKPHVKVWWREGTQSQQLIRDGEVDMMSIWNARASELKQQGVPVEVVWNGAVRSTSTWSVLKGAPNRKLAWELIAYASQAKPQAEFNTRLFYGPIHPDAYAFIPKDIAVQLPTYEDNQAISVREDDQWEADRIVQIEQRFTQWLAS